MTDDPLPLDQAVLRFRRAKLSEGTAERSVEDYGYVLRRFEHAYPLTDLRYFEGRDGTELIREFIETGWSETTTGTQAKVISIVKTFFAWCYEQDLVDRDPAVKLHRPPREGIVRHPQNPALVERVIDAQPKRRDRVAIQLMARLGLRKNELRLLRWDDIDMLSARIRIRRRGGRIERVSITDADLLGELKQLLAELDPAPNDFLMRPTRGSSPTYEPSSMHRWWTTCLKRAKVAHFPMDEIRNVLTEKKSERATPASAVETNREESANFIIESLLYGRRT